jgi:hypothetical protein
LLFSDNLLAFFADRLKVHLRDKGARHDLIDAVFSLGGQDDLALIVKRVEALGEFLKTDDGAVLLAGVKRASNILRDEEKKDKKSWAGTYDLKLLTEKEELALAAAIESVKQDTAAAINVENFAGAMRALAELRAPVDAFFDKVTVKTRIRRSAPIASGCCPRSGPQRCRWPTSRRSRGEWRLAHRPPSCVDGCGEGTASEPRPIMRRKPSAKPSAT